MKLLGRGSVCINTGGEKVFVEEVEEVLKLHDAVHDAVCVGIPDDRFGEKVTAVLSLADGCDLDETVLHDHVRGKLADYKTPRAFLVVEDVPRAANGKPGYKDAKNIALKMLEPISA